MDELHAPAALSLGKESPVGLLYEDAWFSDLFWMWWGREEFRRLSWKSNSLSPDCS
jgi:hypothetical protein